MVDYNQALTVTEAYVAAGRFRPRESSGSRSRSATTTIAGSAAIARALDVPVQIGENFNGPEAMLEALAPAPATS